MEDLFEINPKINPIIVKLFEEYFAIQSNEKVILITEYLSSEDLRYKPLPILESILKRNILMKYIASFLQERFHKNEIELLAYQCQWVRYPKFDEKIMQKIYQADIIFAATEFASLWHVINVRKAKEYNFRAGLAIALTMETISPGGAIDININKLENEVMNTYVKLKRAKKLKIYNKLGTEFEIGSNRKYFFETGKINYSGKLSNIPSGEITILSDEISGKLVVPPGWIEGIKSKVELILENSMVNEINTNSDDAKKIFYGLNGRPPFVARRLTIGMNPNAKNPFSIIELEKMRGVINLALTPKGNYFNPFETVILTGHFPAPKITLEADEEVIIKDGKLII